MSAATSCPTMAGGPSAGAAAPVPFDAPEGHGPEPKATVDACSHSNVTGRTAPAGLRLALVTSERGMRVDPDLPIAWSALREAGFVVDLVRWDDAGADWSTYDLAVVRSCWDYAWRLEEFLSWAASVPRLRNPVEVLRWNTDKTYLRDLQRVGLPVVPAVWNATDVGEVPDAGGRVVKAGVAGGSRGTA